MEPITILLKLLQAQYSISEEQAAALVYEQAEDGTVNREKLRADAAQQLLSKDAERVTSLREGVDTSKAFTDGYNKANGEALTKAEAKLAKHYGVELEKGQKLTDIVDGIIAARTKGVSGELTDDKVKQHPLYTALERSKADELATVKAAADKQAQETEAKYARQSTVSTVKDIGLTYFDKLKPVLSDNPTVAANQRSEFAAKYEGYEYQKQDDGGYLIIGPDGKRQEDPQGNPLNLEGFTRKIASSTFDFAKQDPKGNAGNEGTGGNTITVPQSRDEYEKMHANESDPAKRIALTDAYKAANPGEGA